MAKKNIREKTTFTYTGVGDQGHKVTGDISADNKTMAVALLRKQGIKKIKLSKKKRPSRFSRALAGTRVSAMDVAVFTRQMATMQNAGIPLVQGMNVVINGTDKPGLANLLTKVREEVETGSALSQALKNHPNEFDELFCNLIEAGEKAGTLHDMLDRIATYKEKSESLKRKLKKAMYYPITVFVIAGIVTAILLIKVVPTFKSMFEGFNAELPAFTVMVLNISNVLRQYGGEVSLGLFLIGYFMVWGYKHKKSFRHFVQRNFLRFPVFGKIFHKAVIARFARTLATTFAAGVPLPDALFSVAKVMGNIVYFNAIMLIRENVSGGQQMHTAMQRSNLFPGIVLQMVAIGEEAGTLEFMLSKVAEIYEEEVDTAVDGISTLLEPMIMVILGVVVGGLVVAMYLPVFKMGSIM